MTCEEFSKFVYENNPDWDCEVLPAPTNAQAGLNILIDHFLGDDWYCFSSNNEQANTEAIYEILSRYPKKKSLFQKIKDLFKK